jgi:hypothetical protein
MGQSEMSESPNCDLYDFCDRHDESKVISVTKITVWTAQGKTGKN